MKVTKKQTINAKGIRVGDTVRYGEQRYKVLGVNERAVKIRRHYWVNNSQVEKVIKSGEQG